jgi:hypothetical protein
MEKDFEIIFWKYEGKKVSEILHDTKYFKFLFHRLAERRDNDEKLFYMEELWVKAWHAAEKLIKKPEWHPKRKKQDFKKIEERKFFYHLSENILPVGIPISKVTPEMEEAEDNWVAENHEMIIEHKD